MVVIQGVSVILGCKKKGQRLTRPRKAKNSKRISAFSPLSPSPSCGVVGLVPSS